MHGYIFQQSAGVKFKRKIKNEGKAVCIHVFVCMHMNEYVSTYVCVCVLCVCDSTKKSEIVKC